MLHFTYPSGALVDMTFSELLAIQKSLTEGQSIVWKRQTIVTPPNAAGVLFVALDPLWQGVEICIGANTLQQYGFYKKNAASSKWFV